MGEENNYQWTDDDTNYREIMRHWLPENGNLKLQKTKT